MKHFFHIWSCWADILQLYSPYFASSILIFVAVVECSPSCFYTKAVQSQDYRAFESREGKEVEHETSGAALVFEREERGTLRLWMAKREKGTKSGANELGTRKGFHSQLSIHCRYIALHFLSLLFAMWSLLNVESLKKWNGFLCLSTVRGKRWQIWSYHLLIW